MPRAYSVDSGGKISFWPNERAAVKVGRDESHIADTVIRLHEAPKPDKDTILDALNHDGWASMRDREILYRMRNGKAVDEF